MLLDTLMKNGYLTNAQIANFSAGSQDSIPEQLIKTGILTSQQLANILSTLFREPLHKVQDYNFEDENLFQYNQLVLKHRLLPLEINQGEMLLAVSDPTCNEAQNDFRFSSQLKIKIALVEHQALTMAIQKLYGKVLHEPHSLLPSTEKTLEKLAEVVAIEQHEAVNISADEAPVSQYIQQVLLDAVRKQASDIHFEPFESHYQIRFRIDGKLQLHSSPPAGIARRISSRLKIIAKLNIAERRLPQDGRLKLRLNKEQSIDMRASTLPTLWGEKVVLRLLNTGDVNLSFDSLNLSNGQKNLFLYALDKPQGMILVTGPTGSGKTISLYTGLDYLNTQDRNIATVEDPVEIYLPGINQVNINADIGLCFATALRAFLRQDPDVLMLGEIRDLETAEIAIKAAQTGHLVLSTLHTNSAAESIVRLASMGVAHYNLAASLSLIIAQRLARKLCTQCKLPESTSQHQALRKRYPKLQLNNLYKANTDGCEYCNQGYLGRIGLFEFMPINKVMIDAIFAKKNAVQLTELAISQGMVSIQESSISAINQGITSLNEIRRVISL